MKEAKGKDREYAKGDGKDSKPNVSHLGGNASEQEPKDDVSPLPNYISSEWPIQSLFHGCILGVEWNGGGGEFSTNKNTFVHEDVDISVGRSSAEATASLLALEYMETYGGSASVDFATIEHALTSFGLGFRDELNQQDGDFAFEQTLHRNTFRSLQGEYDDEPENTNIGPDGKPPEGTPLSLNEQSLGSSPNYFKPRKSVMNLTNTRRSTRHDEDRFHDHEEGLKCRVSWNYFEQVGALPCNRIPNNGGLPRDVHYLIDEMSSIHQFASTAEHSINQEMYDLIEQLVYDWRGPYLVNFPSTLGVNGWSQAWIPLFADIRYRRHTLEMRDWELGLADFHLKNEEEAMASLTTSNQWETDVFRTPFTTHSGQNLAAKIREFREEFSGSGRGQLSGLKLLEEMLPNLDMTSITLDFEPPASTNTSINDSISSSVIEIESVTIIDAFGQTQFINTLPGAQDSCVPEISLSLQTKQDDRFILNKPRLQHPARLKFRLIDAQGTSSSTPNPVCGFILCDHLEWAIEVFDHNGEPMGQLALQERDIFDGDNQKSRTKWDPAPGQETSLGQPNEIPNFHMKELFNSLVDHSIRDVGNEQTVTGVLSCFMRLLDSTMDTVYSSPTEAENLPTLFAGRPIALARAELELEIRDSNGPFENVYNASLGSIHRTLDGLLGYFIDDDYSTFYSISNSIEGLSHPFIIHSNQVTLKAGETKQLTLVFDPLSQITARIGVLPERVLQLKSEFRKEALARLAPTYRFGPLLIDPTNVAMPLPSLRQDVNWTWISKPTVPEWNEDSISNDDQNANIPVGRIVAWNGWLKIDPIEDSD